MDILAIVAVRNEAAYIEKCVSYLIRQGIKVAVIDNASEDGTAELLKRFSRRDVLLVDHYPFPGYYDWQGMLERKEEIRRSVPCDWVIHHDADEIMESPRRHESLADGIRRAAALGYDAINFDEFVFLPENDACSYEGSDYVEEMNRYYFFEPRPLRLIRAFRNEPAWSIVKTGGHRPTGGELNVFPKNFNLRHYIALSGEHARRKYTRRVYAPEEVARGWHGNRVVISEQNLVLPDPSKLHTFPYLPWRPFCKRRPQKSHFWEWQETQHTSRSRELPKPESRTRETPLPTRWRFGFSRRAA